MAALSGIGACAVSAGFSAEVILVESEEDVAAVFFFSLLQDSINTVAEAQISNFFIIVFLVLENKCKLFVLVTAESSRALSLPVCKPVYAEASAKPFWTLPLCADFFFYLKTCT